MSIKLYEEQDIQNIVNIIKEKFNLPNTYTIQEIIEELNTIVNDSNDFMYIFLTKDFSGDTLICPNHIKYLRDYLCYNNKNLKTVILPKNIHTIGSRDFKDCSNLQTVIFDTNELRDIEHYAFENCYNLDIQLPDKMPHGHIMTGAFSNCTKLALTKIPDGTVSISDDAFYNCTNLMCSEWKSDIDSYITSIGYRAFYNCKNISFKTIPDCVGQIDTLCFGYCTNLALTKLPKQLWYIGSQAFYKCPNVSFTNIPEEVETIGQEAFYYCTGLTDIKFTNSNSIKIKNNAFYGCSNLHTVTFTNKNEKKYDINSNIFQNCPNLTTINVAWSEGEVAYAPWGATNATINYNYTEEEEGENNDS